MASSSYSFTVISMAVLLKLLLLVPASSLTSTKYINAVCGHVKDKKFCVQTLKAYPPAVSASGKFPVVMAVLCLGRTYALKSARFIEKAATENPNMKRQLKACLYEFADIAISLQFTTLQLKESPDTANYDVQVCTDRTKRVKALLRKNRDTTSKKVMTMTLKMEKLIAIAVGATEVIGG